MQRALSTAVTASILVGVAGAAAAAPVRGIVYEDVDGDGMFGARDRVVPGAVVGYEIDTFTRTDDQGAFAFEVAGPGIVWVRVPDGFAPGPVWHRFDGQRSDFELGLTPLSAATRASPLTFVVASDSHMTPNDKAWSTRDFATSVEQAVALDPPPRFFTIVGDVTQATTSDNFNDANRVLGTLPVPWLPVVGNHDWYDGGGAWRQRFGPDNFSFDIGDVHFVSWNSQMTDARSGTFLRAELAMVDPLKTIVVFGHGTPSQALIDVMRGLGVDYLLTGHWHANRVLDHGGLIELNTETFVMGGIDYTPAGYRVVTIEDGKLRSYHRTVVDDPYVRLVAPVGSGCAAPAGFDLIVAAEVDASQPEVTASIDCGPEIALTAAGGWAYRARVTGSQVGPGPHTLTLRARGVSDSARSDASFEVCDPAPPPERVGGEWPELQGGPTHEGHQARPIGPALETVWTATVGGHLHQGSPVVSNGIVYLSVADLGRGDQGGVVALDLATGVERWRHTTPRSVRNSPAVGNGVVVFGMVDGEVRGLDAATGALRWTYQLSAGLDTPVSALFSSPTINTQRDTAFIGVQGRFAALDLATGTPRWALDPTPRPAWHGTYVAPAVAGGLVISQFDRAASGVVAFDESDGGEVWRLKDGPDLAMGASPVIHDQTVFLANGMAQVGAFDLGDKHQIWDQTLAPGGFDWGFSTPGTPAYADGRLFVATLYGDLVALDAASGAELWRFAAGPSPIHTTHYRGKGMAGFQGSPLVTGGIVWIGGNDGRLTALDAASGTDLWHLDVGAPVMSGLAAAGDYLIVPSWDGTVRALAAPATPRTPATPPEACPPDPTMDDGGCCGTSHRPTGDALLVVVAAVIAWRRPRWHRRRPRPAL